MKKFLIFCFTTFLIFQSCNQRPSSSSTASVDTSKTDTSQKKKIAESAKPIAICYTDCFTNLYNNCARKVLKNMGNFKNFDQVTLASLENLVTPQPPVADNDSLYFYFLQDDNHQIRIGLEYLDKKYIINGSQQFIEYDYTNWKDQYNNNVKPSLHKSCPAASENQTEYLKCTRQDILNMIADFNKEKAIYVTMQYVQIDSSCHCGTISSDPEAVVHWNFLKANNHNSLTFVSIPSSSKTGIRVTGATYDYELSLICPPQCGR